MRRWSPTVFLMSLALLAAFIVPRFVQHLPGQPQMPVTTGPSVSVVAPSAPSLAPTVQLEPGPSGPLTLSQALDKEVLKPGTSNARYLVLEVQAPDATTTDRQSVHISLVMDVSGSMSSEGKMEHAKMAATELLDQLREGDSFSLVTFSDNAQVLIPTMGVDGIAMAKRTLSGVAPEGGTNLHDAIRAGLSQLEGVGNPGARRLVLLSDGMANMGVTDPVELSREASSLVSQGISVSSVGLGLDYSEDTLAAISDAGGGSYRFVNRPGQLSEVFASELRQLSRLVAREATVELSTPPSTQLIEVFGYSSSRTSSGMRVFLGDVHAGETRKIVARVSIEPSAEAEPGDLAPVSLATLSYVTPATETTEVAHFKDLSSLQALLSLSESVVADSVNREASRQGTQAHASWYLDEGARAWERGDRKANREMLGEGEALLRETASAIHDEELAAWAAEVHTQSVAFEAADFDSDDGLYQVKKAKEDARAYAH